MRTRTKLLVSAVVALGAIGLVGAGTFATFTAQDRNPNNVFSTGTIVLSDTVGSGAACLSTAGGTTDSNVNNNCDVAINLTVQKPGDTGHADLTIKNGGSLAASVFKIFSAACANADAAGESYHGTGGPCGKVQLYVQKYSDALFATPSACVYGGSTGGLGVTCDFSDATKTIGAFQAAYNTSSNGLSLGSLAAGASAYYRVAVQLPADADNTYQGRSATTDFTWYAAQ